MYFADNGNGTASLWGTPASGSEGTYDLTINASNGTSPNATQPYVLTVDQASQTISFPAPSSGLVGTPGTLSATGGASGNPVVFTVDPSSGAGVCNVPTGTATVNFTAAGTCTIDANQAGDTDYAAAPQITQSFTVNQVPSITSGASTTFVVGVHKTFTVQTTGSPTPSITETGARPSGVSFSDNGNGTATIAGTPSSGSAGTYELTINASNGLAPAASQSFTLTVLANSPTPTTSALTGLVTNASGGGALANICVYLYPVGNGSTASYATCTLANGSYEFDGVAPGSYDVAFADPADAYTTQWYDGASGGATTQSDASTVSLSAGGATTGINAAMSEAAQGNITGTVTDAVSQADLANICVYLYPVGNGSTASAATCTLAGGGYNLGGVASGSYDVAFADPSGAYATQWYTGSAGGATSQSGATAVTVPTGNGTLSGINAAMSEAGPRQHHRHGDRCRQPGRLGQYLCLPLPGGQRLNSVGRHLHLGRRRLQPRWRGFGLL